MPVALIIGVGAAVGTAAAAKFAAAGYKVAVASRTQRLDPSKFPFFEFDAAELTKVPALFQKVRQEVGVPEVVIYNGMYLLESIGSPCCVTQTFYFLTHLYCEHPLDLDML